MGIGISKAVLFAFDKVNKFSPSCCSCFCLVTLETFESYFRKTFDSLETRERRWTVSSEGEEAGSAERGDGRRPEVVEMWAWPLMRSASRWSWRKAASADFRATNGLVLMKEVEDLNQTTKLTMSLVVTSQTVVVVVAVVVVVVVVVDGETIMLRQSLSGPC